MILPFTYTNFDSVIKLKMETQFYIFTEKYLVSSPVIYFDDYLSGA